LELCERSRGNDSEILYPRKCLERELPELWSLGWVGRRKRRVLET